MKAIKKIILLLLCFAFASACFTACGEQKTENNGNVISLCNFEKDTKIGSVRYINVNKVVYNDDAKYVSEGSTSYKVSSLKDDRPNQEYCAICFYDKFVYNEIDYMDKKCVSLDVYNPYEQEISVAVNVNEGTMKFSELKSGWNNVVTYIDRQELKLNGDVKINAVRYYFDKSKFLDKDFTLYIDNFKMITTDEELVLDETTPTQGKIITPFTKTTELAKIKATAISNNFFDGGTLSINRFDAFTKTGETSLKLQCKVQDNRKINLGVSFTDDEISKKIQSASQTPDQYFKFNVYNSSNKTHYLRVSFYCNTASKNLPFVKSFELPPFSWVEDDVAKVSISDLKTYFSAYYLDIVEVVFEFTGIEDGEVLYIDQLQIA